MAVSGKTAAPHEIPFAVDSDKPPSVPAVSKAMAEQTHARLNAIDPGYRTLIELHQAFANEAAAGTYHFGTGVSANQLANGAKIQGFIVPTFPIVAADYAVTGKATKLRLRMQIASNSVAAASKRTMALYGPYAAGGSSGELELLPGGTIAGSAVESTPAANTYTNVAGADF